jgi:hypothetical protein
MSRLGRGRRCSTTHICFSSTSVSGPSGGWADGSLACRYCCKSPKLTGANFLAVKKSARRPPIYVASITLPRSPVSLLSGDDCRIGSRPRYRGNPASRDSAQRRGGPPHLYTEIASTAKRIFDCQCKKTFATKSAMSGTHAVQKTASLFDQLAGIAAYSNRRK